ncbi:PAS domain-containing protein [Cupriavidus pauculus]|jgi:PAS domain-containing protein|uniref:PAS domain-containing protein n=1 Tax=Cupriavidus pauculus TaxID=82633 RepID=UPI0014784D3F|nr:PAS domain-containing protein [Cupriavidus pauculus]MCM3609576.1 PAS domain-containing protein [Cupriavidus pauculus]UAL00501.1 PAS domain-containing protein [Cupriavidus pauculus]
MLIHTNKFLSRDELPSKWMSMRLYHRAYDRNSENGSVDRIDAVAHGWLVRNILPEFVFERSLPSDSQPFEFETRRQVGLEALRPLPTALALLTTLAITVLSLVILRQRKVAKSQALDVEQRMFRERERALVILQSIADAVLTVDRNGVVEYANPVCEVLLKKSQAAIVGSAIDDVLPIGYDLARRVQSSPFLECLLQRTVVELPEHSYLVREDPERVLVEGSVSPLFDQKQILSGAVIVLRDMGPVRTRALEALQASEQRLRDHQWSCPYTSGHADTARLMTLQSV